MSSTASWRTSSSALLLGVLAGCATPPPGAVRIDANSWVVEAEKEAYVDFRDGALDIDTAAGLTAWFARRLDGPVEISFDATAISAGGANDQVSDLNVFWMASNRDGGSPLATPRSGKFADYDDLKTYY